MFQLRVNKVTEYCTHLQDDDEKICIVNIRLL